MFGVDPGVEDGPTDSGRFGVKESCRGVRLYGETRSPHTGVRGAVEADAPDSADGIRGDFG